MKDLARKLALGLVGLLAAFALCEGLMRAFDLGVLPIPARRGTIHADAADPLLGHVPIPGSQRTFEIQRSRRQAPVQVVEGFNELGLRGPLFPREKAADVFRIACVGDSFTFGYLVDEDETWPAALQRWLDARDDPRTFEVWNFGVFGYETTQELQYLRTRVLEFDPDLVVWAFYINDALPADERERLLREGPGGWRSTLREALGPRAENPLTAARRHSVFLDTVADTLWRRLAGSETQNLYRTVYESNGASWREAQAALLEARDLLAEANIRFAMVLYPHFAREGDGFSSDAAMAVVRRFCEEQGIPVHDLAPHFRDQPIEALRVHPYDFHPSAMAHERAGPAIGAFLAATGRLDPR